MKAPSRVLKMFGNLGEGHPAGWHVRQHGSFTLVTEPAKDSTGEHEPFEHSPVFSLNEPCNELSPLQKLGSDQGGCWSSG